MSNERKLLYPIPGVHEYKGVFCMPDSTVGVLQWLANEVEFKHGDVLICVYPCSGDGWLQEVVWYLHNLDKLDTAKSAPGNRVPNIDHDLIGGKSIKDFFNKSEGPRVFKTRMPADFLVRHLHGKAKFVHWVMDPKHTLLKFQHLYNTIGQRILQFPGHITLDDFFKLFQNKQLLEGDWFDTTLSYLHHADLSNFLFLQYEEEAKDLKRTVQKLADFFNIAVNEDQLKKLVNSCEFDAVTDWKACFSADQLDWYRRKYEEKMIGTRLEKTYL